MNITALLAFYSINSQFQYERSNINTEIAHSLRYVIDNYFVKQSISFVYILSCRHQHTFYSFRDLTEILFSYGDAMKVQIVVNDNDAGPIGPGERNYNLILVDSAESFLNMDPAVKVQNYNFNEYYYVFLQNKEASLPGYIQTILNYCWHHHIINVNILVQKDSGELIVYTYFPFAESHCGNVIPVEVNRYRNGGMDNTDIFPEKLLNMHQCPLKAALWNMPPFVLLDEKKTGREAISGFEGELLKTLSDLMNFRIDYTVPPNDERRGMFLKNRTTGAVQMLQTKQVDLSLGLFQFTIERARALTATETYYQSKQVIILLHDSPHYISPEMILYPFSTTIWALLLTTCAIVLAILACINACVRRIPLGISSIDFLATTLGIPSILSSASHFGRLFITTWMLCTLVIRAEYQALIFHLIRNSFLKLPPNTLDELIQQRYKFVINYFTYDNLGTLPFFQETHFDIEMIAPSNNFTVFTYLEEHPEKKLAAVAASDFLSYYAARNRKAGVFVVLPKAILAQSSGIFLTKHSFLVNRINGLVRWMNAMGLINRWVSKAMDLSYFRVSPQAKQAAIGQEQLMGLYYMCGMLLVLALIVFVVEVLSKRWERLKKAFEKL